MTLRIAAMAVLAALLATCAGDDLARAAAEAGRPRPASVQGAPHDVPGVAARGPLSPSTAAVPLPL